MTSETTLSAVSRVPRLHYAVIVAMTLFAFFWGSYGLNNDPLYFDGEVLSLGHIGALPSQPDYSIVDTLQSVAHWSPQHSPGYFVVLNLYYRLICVSNPAILRTLALFLGVLFVPMMYRLGTQAVSRRVGLIAAVIAGASFPFIDMLHAVRMYAPLVMTLAFVLGQYLYIVKRKREPGLGVWVALFIGSAAALYLSYLAIFAFVGMGAYHLLVVKKDRRWWKVTGVMLLVGVAFLPWLDVMIHGQNVRSVLDNPLNMNGAMLAYASMLSNGGLLLLGTAVLSAAGAVLQSISVRKLVVIWGGTALAFFVFHTIDPLVSTSRSRYFIVLFPASILMIAVGFDWLDKWRVLHRIRWKQVTLTVVMLILWVGMGLYARNKNFLNIYYTTGLKQQDLHTPYHIYLTVLPRYVSPGDTVVTFTGRAAAVEPTKMGISSADYYFSELGVRYVSFIDEYDPVDLEFARAQMDLVMHDETAFWLVVPQIRGDDNFVDYVRLLDERFIACAETISDSDLSITRYGVNQAACDDPESVRLPVPAQPPYGEAVNLTNPP